MHQTWAWHTISQTTGYSGCSLHNLIEIKGKCDPLIIAFKIFKLLYKQQIVDF